jgi:hypothetical protein
MLSSWSGSLADIMEARVSAFTVLTQHPYQNISNAANKLIARISVRIKTERKRELLLDEEREQKFE